ncbi:unnamed protein product [Thlaspi arvense]|uniref:CCR4-NOT transcription complex subunit 1 n=1 Tax=Thlaspi arvense TaxID=13288 RepID=A0AAU9TAK4_THLAR|nr:unnamed protein product [Thlaspi arvense]
MVMKRASIEPNFHDLYLKFLDKVNMKRLNREIVKATYENCKVLLRSELIKSSSEERSLLKNLGSWLGKITIGRNRVLRACDIDPKSLIIEAYEKGLMIAVIPFTSKILEPCQSSRAYKPPNPWTVAILRLLAEIYAMPNLKMNLKFDIEVASPSHPAGHSHILSQYAAPLHLSSGTLMEDQKLATLGLSDLLPVPSARGLLQRKLAFSVGQLPTPAANVEQQIIINPKLSALGLYIHFQSVGPIAICRAIKEVVSNIAQHSVSIATQTTKELVLKEPLRTSMSSQLRNSLPGLNIANELFEQAVQLVTSDNLDLGCTLIEQAAAKKVRFAILLNAYAVSILLNAGSLV